MNAWDDVWLMQRFPSCGVGLTASPGEAWTTMGQGGDEWKSTRRVCKATMLEFISLWFNLDLFFFFFFFFTCVWKSQVFPSSGAGWPSKGWDSFIFLIEYICFNHPNWKPFNRKIATPLYEDKFNRYYLLVYFFSRFNKPNHDGWQVTWRLRHA